MAGWSEYIHAVTRLKGWWAALGSLRHFSMLTPTRHPFFSSERVAHSKKGSTTTEDGKFIAPIPTIKAMNGTRDALPYANGHPPQGPSLNHIILLNNRLVFSSTEVTF